MKDKLGIVQGFYCRECGSTTAVIINNRNLARCMGCLILYCLSDKWIKWDGKAPVHSISSKSDGF